MGLLNLFRNEYASARLRAKKGRLFDRSVLIKMCSSGSLEELAGYLEGTDYEKAIFENKGSGVEVIENSLDRLYAKNVEEISGYYPKNMLPLFEIFLRKFEVMNVKKLAKGILLDGFETGLLVPAGETDWKSVRKITDINVFLGEMKKMGYEKYLKSGMEASKKYGVFSIDFYMDQAYSDICMKITERYGKRDEIRKFLLFRNDANNLRNVSMGVISKKDYSGFLLRPSHISGEFLDSENPGFLSEKLRKIEGFGEMADPSVFRDDNKMEMFVNNGMMSLSRRLLKESPFGLGLLMFYLISREAEKDRIRMMVKFIKEELPRDELKSLIDY